MTLSKSTTAADTRLFRVGACQTEYKHTCIEATDANSAKLIAGESLGGLQLHVIMQGLRVIGSKITLSTVEF